MTKRALLVVKKPTLHELEVRMGDRVKHLKDHAKLCAGAETHNKAVRDVESLLKERGFEVVRVYKEELREHKKRPHAETYDFVVAVGGDGTFSTAARYADGNPFIAVNSDPSHSEGGLACCTTVEFPRLFEDFLTGKARIERHSRALAEVDGKPIGFALNEVFVGPQKAYHTARYVIRHGTADEEQKSSGILISTGSGSTAWYKSAGGKPFPKDSRKLAWLVREPYHGRLTGCKHEQGMVEDDGDIEIESKMYDGMIALDGQEEFPFERGSVLRVRIALEPLQVVKPR